MSVKQTNTWTCDRCGATETTHEETSPYSDPVVVPPIGWKVITDHGIEDQGDLCPKCACATVPT